MIECLQNGGTGQYYNFTLEHTSQEGEAQVVFKFVVSININWFKISEIQTMLYAYTNVQIIMFGTSYEKNFREFELFLVFFFCLFSKNRNDSNKKTYTI